MGLRGSNALRGLEGCTALLTLNLDGCTALQNLSSLPQLPQLESLNLCNCISIRSMDALHGLEKQKELKRLYLPEHLMNDFDKIQMLQQWVGMQCKIVI